MSALDQAYAERDAVAAELEAVAEALDAKINPRRNPVPWVIAGGIVAAGILTAAIVAIARR